MRIRKLLCWNQSKKFKLCCLSFSIRRYPITFKNKKKYISIILKFDDDNKWLKKNSLSLSSAYILHYLGNNNKTKKKRKKRRKDKCCFIEIEILVFFIHLHIAQLNDDK